MAQVGTLTPNETLMGMEANTQADFRTVLLARKLAGKHDPVSFETVRYIDAQGLRISVCYNPQTKWRYELHAGDVHCFFDSREACLDSLVAHWPEVTA